LEKRSAGNDVERLDLSKKTVAEVVAELARHYEALRAQPAIDRLDTSFGAATQNDVADQPHAAVLPGVPPLRDTLEQPVGQAGCELPLSDDTAYVADNAADLDRRQEPVLQRPAAAGQGQFQQNAAWTAGDVNGDVERYPALARPSLPDPAASPRAGRRVAAFGWGLFCGVLLTLLLLAGAVASLRNPTLTARWPLLQLLQSTLRNVSTMTPPAAPAANTPPAAPAANAPSAAPATSSSVPAPSAVPTAAPIPGQPETLPLPVTVPAPAATPAAVAPGSVSPAPPATVPPAAVTPTPQPAGSISPANDTKTSDTKTGDIKTGATKTTAATTKKTTTKTATSKSGKTQTSKTQTAKSKTTAPVVATNKKPAGEAPAVQSTTASSPAPWMQAKPFDPSDVANFPTAAGAPTTPSPTPQSTTLPSTTSPATPSTPATGQPIPLTPSQ
jgi:hypothetical protein